MRAAEAVAAAGIVEARDRGGGGIADSPFQGEVHVRALTFDFLYTLAAHLESWGERTAATATGVSPSR